MKKYVVLTTLLLFLSGIAHAYTTVADSMGVEKKDGKRFILHRVDQGQTLYSIARRYGRSVASIKAANPNMKEAVRYAQIVRIPIPDGSLSRKEAKVMDKAIRKEEKAKNEQVSATTQPTPKQPAKETRDNDDPAKAGIHVVKPAQTLYSLAVRYGVAQSDLRKWNSLSSNNVLIGQALIVSEKAYQVRMPSTPIAAAPAPVKTPTRTETPAKTTPKPERPTPKKTEETPVAKAEAPQSKPENSSTPTSTTASKTEEVEVETPHPGNDAPMPTRGRRIATSGVAEMIDGTDGSGKYLALHRTAPIGTLVQVRNEFNNQSLWVKVIGRLPNTGVNDKILIKLSTQAFAKLSPEDRRFRAEVSYIAP